ncbi:ribonucleases P/MRP protein subunit POP1 [Lingula anatina]|uniref:Ribonucleases P/MRP protein subunit POP1 n=1 Tax=Lingula anatina TaxID=7574 RepID=A0A1S3H3E3_LINAN|nr:ribonucleases P/MRP protein subunit POP1 [Lingula anatina]|eukprot:XP_013380528.1 ribonucleases P/MRP protein subunit POP1 [Lingula anatina]
MDSFANHGYDADGLEEYKQTYYPQGGGDDMEKLVVQQVKDYEEKKEEDISQSSQSKHQIINTAAIRQGQGKKRKIGERDSDDETSILSQAPREINISEFTKSRISEIELLTKTVMSKTSKRNPRQNMPRHMRRRAASHNIKRLPRRLRMQAMAEIESAGKKPKTPSRYHRRRPKNLMAEYNRRQRKQNWLETHIWHAKRFHMIEKWGYVIPHFPNDKSLRAIYRATSKYAVLQDISYLGCIEITGPLKDILHGLEKLTSSEIGPIFGDIRYIQGTRQGSTILYKGGSYPDNAIGEVFFHWKPVTLITSEFSGSTTVSELSDCSLDDDTRTLWVWVHPSFWDEAFAEFKAALKSGLSGKDELYSKEMKHTSQLQQEHSKATSSVIVKSLKDNILRYRLSGPMSTSVLAEVLKPAKLQKENPAGAPDDDSTVRGVTVKKWWQRYYSDPKISQVATQQEEMWRILCGKQTPAQAPSGGILSLTVGDPRILIPPKKSVIDCTDVESTGCRENTVSFTPEVSSSPVWSQMVRDEVKFTQLPQSELNRRKGNMLVPGSTLDLGDDESRIPLLLVQSPGFQRTGPGPAQSHTSPGFGSGWDLILPSGWGMAFWIALVYQGARVGGLRELNSSAVDQGLLRIPYDYPDTQAGAAEERKEWEELEAKYKRYPPAKRPNYIKLGVASPFSYPWLRLVQEWSNIKKQGAPFIDHNIITQDSRKLDRCLDQKTHTNQISAEILEPMDSEEIEEFVVLRTRNLLKYLDRICHAASMETESSPSNMEMSNSDKISLNPQTDISSTGGIDGQEMLLTLSQMHNAIVPVTLNLVSRGAPADHSMICIPTQGDLDSLAKDSRYGGPLEQRKQDPNSRKVKKQKIKQKGTQQGTADKVKVHNFQDTLIEPKDVAVTSSRVVIGYLKTGGFTYTSGRGTGRGFCALQGILHALELNPGKDFIVLVRSPASYQYRFAFMKILC